MIAFRKKYAPGTCAYSSGVKEIRWDVVGCNLRCQFCWSPASRPEKTGKAKVYKSPDEVLIDTLMESSKESRVFIRFTGGEPTLYWDELLRVFSLLGKNAQTRTIPILIQTNGIRIGKGEIDIEALNSGDAKHLDFLFELSLKGTNSEEFGILTGRDSELYEFQLKGYDDLLALSRTHRKVSVVAVLGVYHSSVSGNSKYVFVNPHNYGILFENSTLWDPRFERLWNSARLKWVEPLRMSPKGMWEDLWRRCGPEGSGILKHYPQSRRTNQMSFFPAKPKSYKYAQMLADRTFWQ